MEYLLQKINGYLLFFLAFILLSKIFIKNEIVVFDIINQCITDDFIIKIPVVSILFEPFVGLIRFTCIVFKTPYDFICIPVVFTVLMLFIVRNLIRSIIYAISLMIIFSYPFNIYLQKKLIPRNENYSLVDFHSHTRFSHDGLTTIKQNSKFHSACGHNFFAITDHNDSSAYFIAKSKYKYQTIIPGIEITDASGNHLLVYGEDAILSVKKFENPKKIIQKVKRLNGITILAHPWELKDKIQDYINYGIDGLEIYSLTSNPPDNLTINKIIESLKDKNIILLAGTNFHGYGYVNIYTAIPKSLTSTPEKLISSLRQNPSDIKLLRLCDRFISNGKPIFLIPFGYFSSLNELQIFSWIIWLIFFSFFQKLKNIFKVFILLSLLYSLINLLIASTPFTINFVILIIVLLFLIFVFF